MTDASQPSRGVARRLGALCALLVALLALAVWFGALAPAPALGAYPQDERVVSDFDRYVGERVVVGGTVRTADPVTVAVEDGAGGTVRVTVTGLATAVDEGEYLRVYGVAAPDRTVRAESAVPVPRWGRWYAYVVSALAGVWVLARIGRYWRVDTRAWTLERRDSPAGWRALVGRRWKDA
ncbi:MAG: hypothetical protein ABEJ61_07260 [Haloferacaceae archaeon]